RATSGQRRQDRARARLYSQDIGALESNAADDGEKKAMSSALRVWMDVMRHLEPVMVDHARLFDAWEAGGVTGLVIGPMAFEDKTFTFDPNPEVYGRFGLEPPRAQESDSLWWKSPSATPGLPDTVEGRRALLCKTLQAAKDRGWAIW